MVWPAVIAGAAALGGSMINSLTGTDESRANRKEARRQFNIQTDQSIQRRVKDALAAGINPLAALGASVNSSPTVHAGGGYPDTSLGDGITKVGGIIAQAMQDKQVDDMEFDTQAKELDLEGKRLENQILKNKLNTMTNQPGVDLESPPSMDGEQLLFSPVYDMQGRPRLVVNQNALEADSDNPGYMSSIISGIASGIKNGQIDPVSGEIKSAQLRMMIDDFYYNTTGHHIKNLESLYVSPAEAAMAASMLARGVS